MNDEQLQQSVRLQRELSALLAELGFVQLEQADRISRQMAEIATRGKLVAEELIPLLVQMPRENQIPISQVALAIKLQLEELSDSLNDLRTYLTDWTEFFSLKLRQ